MKTIRRRRKESKTSFKKRFGLLKSGKSRLVVRKTNRYIIIQIVETTVAQDKVLLTLSSKELLENNWPKEKSGSLKSLHAAYLTGFLLAKKTKSKDFILDIGLQRSIHGSRIFAAVKGAIDGGLKIPHNKNALPTEDRFKSNKELYNLMNRIKEKIHG